MYNIKLLNKISNVGLAKFDTKEFAYSDDMENPDAIMVRSASMHDMEMPESLLAIARAGAGTNNIPVADCANKGIVVFNTPGANANAVKELVVLGMLLSSRKVTKAIDWCKTIKDEGDNVGKTVEKGKSAFAGPELKGKTLGVIGLGAIGRLVAEVAVDLGMDVIGYDPYLPEDAVLKKGITVNNNLDEIFPVADYITVHVPLTPDTKHMINRESIEKMKDTVRIMNFARGDLADSDAVIEALDEGKMACYVTDFPDAKLIGVDGVIAIPHLGASTPESEENCAAMGAQELIDYLVDGNIKNSVNMPPVFMPRTGVARVTIIHKNQPNMIATITDTFSKDGVNIASFEDKSRGDIAYSIIECDSDVTDAAAKEIEAIDGVIRVRVIK
ncbi:phosphoglycerate dehydrogenase [Eubacterium coprostanoligenes]|uniref:D-3-phosphoglycerate dehydrogenase n=1 Tax=Eubacterium coprostanoligenes TaxID=290054 RepID=A0A1T4L5H6_9FIRM|nr:phosphoglycerate dehydrogenase [Eubacterium coprostanoligenes]MCI6253284.1 phosphoglycerate dehydrogenase [Eubacterium coprostanoligenes]MCI6353888.1 phosphoglycerate dehydrogenase [Eubacterium coprostanoligenes]MDD6666067.1 phosphoglycerate dehydrogenase [Eubacterium coprostanoligenes]MDD7357771.1 phosphoglycerate dehydrogenase [Eubacterium coprostanoligenes]MDY4699044.1 phosphoglycerate dehydrogenase [Eubacterium coprostanoligenes]